VNWLVRRLESACSIESIAMYQRCVETKSEVSFLLISHFDFSELGRRRKNVSSFSFLVISLFLVNFAAQDIQETKIKVNHIRDTTKKSVNFNLLFGQYSVVAVIQFLLCNDRIAIG
jgi:hypothetical protein